MEQNAAEGNGLAARACLTDDSISRCIWLNLELKESAPHHNVKLSYSFGQGRIEALGGCVDFGLKQAEIAVETSHGSIPIGSRWPNNPLPSAGYIRRSQTAEQKEERQLYSEAGGNASIKGAGGTLSLKQSDKKALETAATDEFDLSVRSVSCSGSPTKAVWRFKPEIGHEYIEAQLDGQTIGRLVFDEGFDQAAIRAQCEIMRRYILIVDSEGFLARLATGNKWVVLQAFIRKVIFDHIQSNLPEIYLEVARDE